MAEGCVGGFQRTPERAPEGPRRVSRRGLKGGVTRVQNGAYKGLGFGGPPTETLCSCQSELNGLTQALDRKWFGLQANLGTCADWCSSTLGPNQKPRVATWPQSSRDAEARFWCSGSGA